MLTVICIAIILRLGHATGGAHEWACCGLRLDATWAEFQHSVVYYAIDQCWKRLEACINAEHGHSEHLLWRCLPDIPVSTHHNRFFSEPLMTTHNWLSLEPPTFERTQQTFSQMKKFFAFQKLVLWNFQVGWASGLQFVFSWHHNQFYSEPPMTTHNWLSLDPPVFERTQQTCPVKSTVDYIMAGEQSQGS